MAERPVEFASLAGELTDGERMLLEHIRAGRVDAEIAVRLGIPTGEVKERIERLAAKLRVDGREGLRSDTVAPELPAAVDSVLVAGASGRRFALVLVAIVALALSFSAGVFVASYGDDEATEAVADEPGATPTAESMRSATPQPTIPPRIEIIDGREMEYAGQIFMVPFGQLPVAGTSARERMLAVTLSDAGLLRLGFSWYAFNAGPAGISLSATLRDREVYLQVQPGNAATGLITGARDTVGIYTTDVSQQPVLLLTASDGQGRLHLRMNTSGELFVSLDATRPDGLYDDMTGELLHAEDATRVWTLVRSNGFAFTRCPEGRCEVVLSNIEMRAPSLGTVSCPEPEVIRLELASLALTLVRVRQVDAQDPLVCTPGTFDSGQAFAPVDNYVVTAQFPDGTPLSLAARDDGTVWAGSFVGTAGCPCLDLD